MKRTIVLAAVASLLATGAVTATAAPKAKAPKPVTTTFFFHGTQPIGEAEGQAAEFYLPMDATAPTGTSAKSYGVTNYVAGPNTQCSGNALFPTWTGTIDGAPTGTASLEVFMQGAGTGNITASLFADVYDAGACNDAFVPPIATATFAVPNGAATVKVDFKNVNKKGRNFSNLIVMLAPGDALGAPFVARVNYDATSAASKLTFSCIPKAGKKTC